VTTDGPYVTLSAPSLNAAGRVAYAGTREDHATTIFTGPGQVPYVAANATFSDIVPRAVINNSGTVAFHSALADGTSGLFRGANLPADTAATNAGPYNRFGRFSMNGAGVVAFMAFRDGGASGGSGIYKGPDAAADAVATTDASYTRFGTPAINDAGVVVFAADRAGGGQGIFKGPDAASYALFTTDGPFSAFGDPAINTAGTVAFRGLLDAGGVGIFAGPGADKVVASGDELFGALVTDVTNMRQGTLTDAGDIAFAYSLSNGVRGVAVALTSHRYTAAAGGSFDDPANFAFRGVPGAAVPTFITPANGLVVAGPAAPRTLHSLTLGTAGNGVAELRLVPAGQLTVLGNLRVQAGGKLRLDGAVAATGELFNAGDVELRDDAQLNGGRLFNTGTLRGDGTLGFGRIQNYGRIEAIGTAAAPVEMAFTTLVENYLPDGTIVARDAALRFRGGLTNGGTVAFPFGAADAFGAIVNAGGTITVTGGAAVTFHDDVTQNGTLRVSTAGSTTSVAVFLGTFRGAGGATGGGDIFFEGGVQVGNSPAVATFDADVHLGGGAHTVIEVAGTAAGQFDQLVVNGDLALDGTLGLIPLGGFTFGPNQSFTIFDVSGDLSGAFTGLPEGARLGAFGGADVFITYAAGPAGHDVALFTVPEPSAAGLLALGAAAALRRRRRMPAPARA